MSILGSHLSHKENREMFILHTSEHPELHPFRDKNARAIYSPFHKQSRMLEISGTLVRFLNKYCVGISND